MGAVVSYLYKDGVKYSTKYDTSSKADLVDEYCPTGYASSNISYDDSGASQWTFSFSYGPAPSFQVSLYGNGTIYLSIYYTLRSFTVTVEDNNGTGAAGTTYNYSATSQKVSITLPTREGYEISSWDSTLDGVVISGNEVTIPAKAKASFTLTPQWNHISYTVSILSEAGGSVTSTVTYYYSAWDQTVTITLPTKTGQYIDEWTKTSGTGTFSISGSTLTIGAKTTSDATMTPTWKAYTYTYTIYSDYGVTVCSGTYECDTSSDQTFTITLPTKTGYYISKWTASSGSATISGTTLTIPKGTAISFSMTPTCTVHTYTVAYDNYFCYSEWYWSSSASLTSEGGKLEKDLSNGTLTITANANCRHVHTNYAAEKNWQTTYFQMYCGGGTSNTISFEASSTSSSPTFEAFYVCLDSTGAIIKNGSYDYFWCGQGVKEKTFTAPTGCTRLQLFFAVHNTDSSGAAKTTSETVTFSKIRFHTKWRISIGPKEAYKMVTYNISGTYGTLASASWTGYTFKGWNTAGDGTGETITSYTRLKGQNLTLLSQWSPNQYTLTLTKGTGISTIYYKVNGETSYGGTTLGTTVQVNYGSTWYAYAEAAEGYSYSDTSLDEPETGTMGTSGATFAPSATANKYKLTLMLDTGISTIYYKVNGATSYSSTTSTIMVDVDFDSTWYAYATAATGYSYSDTSLKNPEHDTMSTNGAVFHPSGTANKYKLTLMLDTGISTIYYKVNGATSYSSTTSSTTVQVNYGSTWFAYAEAAEGYSYRATSLKNPEIDTMGTSGATFAPSATAIKYTLTLTKGTGISTIYYKVNGETSYSSTTSTIMVDVDFDSTWYAYATAATGYSYSATSSWNPQTDTMGTSGATFAPSATANKYTLTLTKDTGISKIYYKVNGATDYSSTTSSTTVQVNYGSTWYAYAEAATGYSYSDTSLDEPQTDTMGTSGATFAPSGTANKYEVTLNQNNGSGGSSSVQATYNAAMPSATMPTRTGYRFNGYYLSNTQYYTSAGASARSWDKAEKSTLTASWTVYSYIIKFYNGTTLCSTTQTVYYNTEFTLNANPFTKTKYRFKGWAESDNGKILYKDKATLTWTGMTSVGKEKKLYAIWERIPCVVRFDANGGAVTNDDNLRVIPCGDYITHNTNIYPSYNAGLISQMTNGTSCADNQFTVKTSNSSTTNYAWSIFSTFPLDFIDAGDPYNVFMIVDEITKSDVDAKYIHCDYASASYPSTNTQGQLNRAGTTEEITSTGVTLGKSVLASVRDAENFPNLVFTRGYLRLKKATSASVPAEVDVKFKIAVYAGRAVTVKNVAWKEPYEEYMWCNLPTATRTGYTLDAWYTKASGGTAITTSTVISSSQTVYAHWTVNSYTVKYNANGGSGTMSDQSRTYDDGKALTANAFTRTGYTFAGWAKSSGGSKEYDDQAKGNLADTAGATVNLYAVWTANSYTVKYNANGGSGTMSDQSRTYDDGKALTANAFTRTGYTFAGWAKSSGGSKEYDNQAKGNLADTAGATVNLYAVWTANTIVVTFDGNGANNGQSEYTQDFTYGVAQSLTNNNYERKLTVTFNTNYTDGATSTQTAKANFVRWADTSSGTYNYGYGNQQTVTNPCGSTGAAKTLYARWTDQSITLETPTTRTGYAFTGWYDKASNGTLIGLASASYTPTKDITLYAYWETAKYKVSVYSDDASVQDISYNINTSEKEYTITTITKTGYHLTGWTVGSGYSPTSPSPTVSEWTLTIPANCTGDFNITAKWEINTYTVKFYDNMGGESEDCFTQTFSYNETKNLTAKPAEWVVVGKNYLGWATDRTSTSVNYTDKQLVTNLTTENGAEFSLYAVWQAILYEVNLAVNYSNRGSATGGGKTFTYGSKAKLTATRNDGYYFEKWQKLNSDDEWEDTGSTSTTYSPTITANVSYRAVFEISEYDVSYIDTDGSTLKATHKADYASTVTAPPATEITKTGYRLEKWQDTATGNYYLQGTTFSMPSRDVELKANWLANTYTVEYKANANTATGTTASTTHTYNATGESLAANGFSRPGYDFAGKWKDASGNEYTPGVQAEALNLTTAHEATVTLYATWTAHWYTVNYNANYEDPEGSTPSQTLTYDGEETQLSPNGFNPPANKQFWYWNTQKDGKGVVYYADSEHKYKNLTDGTEITLYAIWGGIPVIVTTESSPAAGGSTSGGKNYEAGQKITLTANAYTAGYTFSKWTKDGSVVSTSATYEKENCVETDAGLYTAVFTAKMFNITVTDGTAVTYTFSESEQEVSFTTPTSTGHVISGWTVTGVPEGVETPPTVIDNNKVKIPAETNYNFTITPTWTANKHTVTIAPGTKGLATSTIQFEYLVDAQTKTVTAPTATGYHICEWTVTGYTGTGMPSISESSGVYTLNIPAGADCDFTMTPTWAGNTYTVTLDRNGGTTGSTSVSNVVYGEDMPTGEAVVMPTYEGHDFVGYYIGGSQYYDSEGESANKWDVASDATLTALWDTGNFVITVSKNIEIAGKVEGSGTYAFNSSIIISAYAYTGYRFLKWNDGILTSSRTITVKGDKEYIAIFGGSEYVISLNDNGGSGGSGSVTVEYGADMPSVAVPTMAGYSFAGYYYINTKYYNADGTSAKKWDRKTDIELMASWNVAQCTIYYKPGKYGCEEAFEEEREEGQSYITLRGISFTRNEQYIQTGWATTDGGEKVYDLGQSYTGSANLELYPVWSLSYAEAKFYQYYDDSDAVLFETKVNDETMTIPTAPAITGKEFVRYAPYVNATRNDIESLTVTYGVNTYVLSRETTSTSRGRAIDENNVYTDRWVYDSNTISIAMVYSEYEIFDITIGIGTHSYRLSDVAAQDGKTEISVPEQLVLGGSPITVMVNSTFVDNSGNVNYYAMYRVPTTQKYYVQFWHLDKDSKQVIDASGNYDIGSSISDLKPTENPKLTTDGAWAGSWTPTPEGELYTTRYYEFVFTSTGTITLDWNNPSVRSSTTLNLTWGSSYPTLFSVPTCEGYAIKEINLMYTAEAEGSSPTVVEKVYNSRLVSIATVRGEGLATKFGQYSLKAEWVSTAEMIDTLENLREQMDVIPEPFAAMPSSQKTIIAQLPVGTSVEQVVNFKDGFTSAYNTTLNAGGKVITRQDVNMLGRYGSQCQFFEQCGGYHTFDPEICEAIGGYPKGAILNVYDEDTNEFRTVKSLENDNEINFLTEGVDGVSWKYVDVNPKVNISVDYSDYLDLGDTLFVESGIPDLYEVPYDSYLQLFAVGTIDCSCLKREEYDDTSIKVGIKSYDETKTFYEQYEYEYEGINGMYRSKARGISTVDIYHANTQSFGSAVIGGFYPFSFKDYQFYALTGEVRQFWAHFTKTCPISSFSAGLMLSKGDKIRIRNSLTDVHSEESTIGTDDPKLEDRIFTDDLLKRIYTVRFANLYRRGVSI